MFLTRLGFGSKMVVTGDVTQIDLPKGRASGLALVPDVLGDVARHRVRRLRPARTSCATSSCSASWPPTRSTASAPRVRRRPAAPRERARRRGPQPDALRSRRRPREPTGAARPPGGGRDQRRARRAVRRRAPHAAAQPRPPRRGPRHRRPRLPARALAAARGNPGAPRARPRSRRQRRGCSATWSSASSRPTARRRGPGLPLALEVALLLVHGTLHVVGYDHDADAGQMALRQAAAPRRRSSGRASLHQGSRAARHAASELQLTPSRASSTCCARSATCASTSSCRLPVLDRGLFFDLTRLEIVALFVAITFVLIAEMMNTALEHAIDIFTIALRPAGQDRQGRGRRRRADRRRQRAGRRLPDLLRQARGRAVHGAQQGPQLAAST